MRKLYSAVALAVLSVFLVMPAYAGSIGASAGTTHDFIRTKAGEDFQDWNTPMAAVAWDLAAAADSSRGASIILRGSDGVDLIQQYGLEYWRKTFSFRTVMGVTFETWNKGITGKREFLGGLRLGVRGADMPIEFSTNISVGDNSAMHIDIFAGVRVAEI